MKSLCGNAEERTVRQKVLILVWALYLANTAYYAYFLIDNTAPRFFTLNSFDAGTDRDDDSFKPVIVLTATGVHRPGGEFKQSLGPTEELAERTLSQECLDIDSRVHEMDIIDDEGNTIRGSSLDELPHIVDEENTPYKQALIVTSHQIQQYLNSQANCLFVSPFATWFEATALVTWLTFGLLTVYLGLILSNERLWQVSSGKALGGSGLVALSWIVLILFFVHLVLGVFSFGATEDLYDTLHADLVWDHQLYNVGFRWPKLPRYPGVDGLVQNKFTGANSPEAGIRYGFYSCKEVNVHVEQAPDAPVVAVAQGAATTTSNDIPICIQTDPSYFFIILFDFVLPGGALLYYVGFLFYQTLKKAATPEEEGFTLAHF